MSEGRRHAILIAASEFPEEPSLATLRCPKNDAEGVASTLTSLEYGLFTNPLLFVNELHHTTLRAINRVFKQAARQDQILIYYSGHGKLDGAGHLHLTTTDTEADALETSSIPVGTLLRLIENYDCKQVALILDCCFSGAVGKEFKSGVDDQLQLVSQTRGVYILTASTAIQTAKEKEGDQYSLFTKHILHGIKQGEADYDNDGLVSIDDLYEYTRLRVPLEGAQQPRKWTLDAQGGKLIIARAAALYSTQQLQEFKKLINKLDENEEIDEEICDQVRLIIRQNQPRRDKRPFELLNQLNKGILKPGKFITLWSKEFTTPPAPTIPPFVVTPSSGQPADVSKLISKPANEKREPTSHIAPRQTILPEGGIPKPVSEERLKVEAESRQKAKQQNLVRQSRPKVTTEIEQRAHNDAGKFARLLVSEIKLYNAALVNEGRRNFDIYDRLTKEIDRSRIVYDKRVSPAVHAKFDYFYDELVQTLAEGDVNKMGPNCPGPQINSAS